MTTGRDAAEGRGFLAGLLLALGFWTAIFLWLGARTDPPWRGYGYREGTYDYYNLLVDGFMSGHLAMDAPVHPDRLSPDPLVRGRAPYMLDAALYHGRYYLYYGVTPAAVLLYPYARLTGRHLGCAAACVAFVILGFGVSVSWLPFLRRRLAADWGAGFAVAAVSILAAVPGTTFLVRRGAFYELPIAAGYACMSVFWVALWKAWSGGRAGPWLVLASAAFGLAVGCRANLLLVGLALPAIVWILSRRAGQKPASLWLSAVAPAGVIGFGLAWYNWARFGDPLELGFKYGLNSFFDTGNPLFSLRFLPANAKAYLLTPPSLATWFPFDFPIDSGPSPSLYSNAENMHGFLPVTALAGWILIWRFLGPKKMQAEDGAFTLWCRLLAAAIAIEAGFTFLLGIRGSRYATDFLTPLPFLLVAALARVRPPAGLRGGIVRAGTALLVLAASLHAVLGAVQLFGGFKAERPGEFAALSKWMNPQQATLEKLGGNKPGGMTLKVRFFRPAAATEVPLVTTGLANSFDSLIATVHPSGAMELGIYHSAYGGAHTQLIPVVWGRSYTIDVFMGSLYPAGNDRFFSTWPEKNVKLAKSIAWLRFDGRTVLNRQVAYYESSPWPASLHKDDSAARVAAIDSLVSGVPIPQELVTANQASPAIYSLQLALPPARKTRPMPILCSGVTGHGNLLYFDPLPDGRYRLAVDVWSIGALFGEPFDPGMGGLHSVQIVAGPALPSDLQPAQSLTKEEIVALQDRLLVWYDGRLVGDFKIEHYLETFDSLLVGLNEAGFSSAVGAFQGEIHNLSVPPIQREQLLEKALGVVRPPSR